MDSPNLLSMKFSHTHRLCRCFGELPGNEKYMHLINMTGYCAEIVLIHHVVGIHVRGCGTRNSSELDEN